MASLNTADHFPGIPQFPESVPTAPLLRISLSKLLHGDTAEEEQLWRACCDLGFFYLDLRSEVLNGNGIVSNGHAQGNARVNGTNGDNGSKLTSGTIDGNSLLEDADKLFIVGDELFQLPVEEKQQYDFADQGSYFGYKGYGSGVIDKEGTKDRNEFYNVSKNDILNISDPLPAPPLLDQYRPLLRSYIQSSHSLITMLLGILNKRLQLPEFKLQDLHRLHAVSGDQVRFVKAPPQPKEDRRTALGAHTDFGSVTVLFNKLGGLQVRLPAGVEPVPPKSSQNGSADEGLTGAENGEDEQWVYVRPLPGHAIINLGDAMVKFSAGILRSNVHRVVSPSGLQAERTRFSLVYFSRPEDEVLLGPLKVSPMIAARAGDEEEEVISSKDWILRRALGRRGKGKFEDSEGTETARGIRG